MKAIVITKVYKSVDMGECSYDLKELHKTLDDARQSLLYKILLDSRKAIDKVRFSKNYYTFTDDIGNVYKYRIRVPNAIDGKTIIGLSKEQEDLIFNK